MYVRRYPTLDAALAMPFVPASVTAALSAAWDRVPHGGVIQYVEDGSNSD